MAKFLKQFSCTLESKDVKDNEKDVVHKSINDMLKDFGEAILEPLMAKDKERKLLIQWAISEAEENNV